MRASQLRIFGRSWSPLLAGADLPDRLFACVGATCGIALTGWLSGWLLGWPSALLLIAPMGASAVLVFAVPASPLAQPWPVIGGNVLSALVGIGIARVVPMPGLAAGLAVGGAILVMSLTRSLHPPGGASALLAVIGGPAISAAGFGFAFVPVALNAMLLALAGVAFHRLSRHSYPHHALAAPPTAPFLTADIDLALADLGDGFDVSRADLEALIGRVAFHAAARTRQRR
ncbi:HPP family protein [Sphingomonas sp. PAMC 26605]|uniref:HPP family protein n=1 Tax=Sphingomonas sp. PAMC 26605 TaxID=1112214 RepID=UPI0002FF7F7B|nr:HPP family protein [Sphingomonas sp. PAMC 26605]